MWELYDKLIEQVDGDHVAEEVVAGLAWTATKSKTVGLAMTYAQMIDQSSLSGTCQGRSVKELAKMVKSWNLLEAGVGLSAINSTINTYESIKEMENHGYHQLPSGSAFDLLTDHVYGKKVAVIGHFPSLEGLAKECQLTILERQPQIGDLPDSAAEYILPEQDIVLMTSSTLVNKTTPRLLELSRDAVTIMTGPSTPLSPILFEMGVDIIGGMIVEDEEYVFRCIKEGGGMHSFRNSVKYVNIAKNAYPLKRNEAKQSERI